MKILSFSIIQAFVKSSNPAFNPTKHPYELSLTTASEVVEVRDSLSGDVPEAKYDYVRIGDIESKPENELVDVIGVCIGNGAKPLNLRNTCAHIIIIFLNKVGNKSIKKPQYITGIKWN